VISIVQFIAGLVLLLFGAESLVRGAVSLARKLNVTPMIIGMTIVAYGTTAPELVVSLESAFNGLPGIAVGNVVGSNIANILLILGAAAVIVPAAAAARPLGRDVGTLIAASLLLLAASLSGGIGRATGIAFLVLLAGYTVVSALTDRGDTGAAPTPAGGATGTVPGAMSPTRGAALTLGGIAATVLGAYLVVKAAIAIAGAAGLSEAVVGLTLVAVGTSLPELATSITAAFRRHGELALGNVIGSCIFNILGIAGTTAAITPIAVPDEIARLDIWVMVATALLLAPFAIAGWRVGRAAGAAFLIAYAGYIMVALSPGARAWLGAA